MLLVNKKGKTASITYLKISRQTKSQTLRAYLPSLMMCLPAQIKGSRVRHYTNTASPSVRIGLLVGYIAIRCLCLHRHQVVLSVSGRGRSAVQAVCIVPLHKVCVFQAVVIIVTPSLVALKENYVPCNKMPYRAAPQKLLEEQRQQGISEECTGPRERASPAFLVEKAGSTRDTPKYRVVCLIMSGFLIEGDGRYTATSKLCRNFIVPATRSTRERLSFRSRNPD